MAVYIDNARMARPYRDGVKYNGYVNGRRIWLATGGGVDWYIFFSPSVGVHWANSQVGEEQTTGLLANGDWEIEEVM
jgi:hypothetical protein